MSAAVDELDLRPLRERLAGLQLESLDADEANERLERARLTDGLPVVPPVAAKVAAMLGGADATAPGTSLPIPPGFAVPSLWEVAACAVLAGCRPGALPLIVTALEAVVQPPFNLLGVQTTTGAAAPLLIVNGPVAHELDLNAGHNALGPGRRSNTTIGRAVRLTLQNVGVCLPGEGDMATHGQPGKVSWLVVENEIESPWEALHVSRGLDAQESAVTVVAAVGNVEVVLPTTTPEAVVEALAGAMVAGRGEAVLLVPPESAQFLAAHGWDRGRLQRALCEGAARARSPDEVLIVVTGGPGIKATLLPGWGGGSRAVTTGLVTLGG